MSRNWTCPSFGFDCSRVSRLVEDGSGRCFAFMHGCFYCFGHLDVFV